ncbi:hypothetical protein BDN70DRAFT_876780 [Pholiota conissans]|uniref:Tetratricopeptide repeat protein 39B n=1 Tax=Pholiota conissans TaxID=109636 RepID=A0A9P5Z562_9AGAR|nr:hypothetical protein BDN70DRAFT_876780 [Pholiota conissans]
MSLLTSIFGSSSPLTIDIDPKQDTHPEEPDSDTDTASTSTTNSMNTTTGATDRAGGLLTPATSTYPPSEAGSPIVAKLAGVATTSTTTATTPTTTTSPSYVSQHLIPPPVAHPYTPSIALSDLPCVQYALETFLRSQMLESEDYMRKGDEKMERLYFATGFGLIQCVKGLMSYEDEDLLAALQHTKHGNTIAAAHRKKSSFLGSIVSVVHGGGASVSHIKSMTDIERHAELVYAESLFEKALLGIVYSGDWLAFVREALNMRTTISVYRALGAYLEAIDAAHPTGHDPSADEHFRSGVYLGVGLSNIILSLMPGKLMALVELFGYHGDRKVGLEMLMRAGGWGEGDEPAIGAKEEGVRRSICDMALLIFHLVLSSFTFEGVDTGVAARILKWNLKRYPNGVFFLFGAGRLGLMHSQPTQAIYYYTKALESQTQYRNLHHISFWEMAIANLALWDVEASLRCWRDLEREATWSKAIYSYGMAVCLLESKTEDETEKKKRRDEAARLMERVPGLRQKIAGKSIPLEKFVARKARKFTAQGRLAVPALEMAYLFQGITHAPRGIIVRWMLPELEGALKALGVWEEVVALESQSAGGSKKAPSKTSEKEWKAREKKYHGGKGYWDDYCLVMFLRGVCMRYVAYPDPDAELDPADDASTTTAIPQAQAARAAELAFQAVFAYGPKIELDHHLVYHAHYEYGRLLANLPPESITSPPVSTLSRTHSTASSPHDADSASHTHTAAESAALAQFELILSGRYLEVGPSGKKGKYSMENALAMRTHAAVAVLGKGGRL